MIGTPRGKSLMESQTPDRILILVSSQNGFISFH